MPRMAFEVRRGVETPVRHGDGIVVGRQERAQLDVRPNVEFSFLAFAVRVEAGIKRAIGRPHLPRHPADNAAGDVGKPLFSGHAGEVGVQAQQWAIVIEHLLEMRNGPFGVHTVPAEAAAQLVVYAAIGHPRQRHPDDGQRVGIAGARGHAHA
jgi:hypothetical protein